MGAAGMRFSRVFRHAWLVVPVTGAVFWIYVASAGAGVTSASARLVDLQGRPVGRVSFTQLTGIDSKIRYDVRRLTPGFHALHIHVNGTCDPKSGFENVGPHYDQFDRAQPFDGDMPVVLVNSDRTGTGMFVTDRFEVGDVVGMAVVVHELPDNYDNVPVGDRAADYSPNGPAALARTRATGNAGPVVACGVIRESG
jgi:superoxide dismutase, Cu-Zn family